MTYTFDFYGVSKLDSIVEEVVRQIFAQFREVSRKKLLESVKTNDAARIQKKVKKIQKDLESKQKELDDLKAETILVIRGVSALDKELLGTLVAEAREALETLEKQLVQAQEEYEEATKTAKRSNYICNELFTWAELCKMQRKKRETDGFSKSTWMTPPGSHPTSGFGARHGLPKFFGHKKRRIVQNDAANWWTWRDSNP